MEIGTKIEDKDWDWEFGPGNVTGIGYWHWDWGSPWEFGIPNGDLDLDWALRFVMGKCEIGLRIGDWEWGLELRIEIGDWGLEWCLD